MSLCFSYIFQKTGFDISCKLSSAKTFCMKCQPCFQGKLRKKYDKAAICWINPESARGNWIWIYPVCSALMYNYSVIFLRNLKGKLQCAQNIKWARSNKKMSSSICEMDMLRSSRTSAVTSEPSLFLDILCTVCWFCKQAGKTMQMCGKIWAIPIGIHLKICFSLELAHIRWQTKSTKIFWLLLKMKILRLLRALIP